MRKIQTRGRLFQLSAFCVAYQAATSAASSRGGLRRTQMRKLTGLVVLSPGAAVCAPAQQLDFKQAATADPAELAEAMPALARAVIAAYHHADRGEHQVPAASGLSEHRAARTVARAGGRRQALRHPR